jgi:zinc protease
MKRALLIIALLQWSAFAQQVAPPPPAAPRDVTVPQPVERTLTNGLRVIVVQKSSVPLVAARLMVKSGGEADPAGSAGLADMTASLLTKGTTTKSAEQIARGVEALGATIESGAAWDSSAVNLSALSSNVAQAMTYVADVVRNPTFKSDEIERLREQNIDALRVAVQDPSNLADFVATKAIFGSAPYGHNLGGTPESLLKVTRADIVAFHRRFYRPDNSVLVITGDMKPETAFSLAESLFGTWKRPDAPLPSAESSTVAAPEPRVIVVDMPDAGQAAVVVARQGLRRVDPSYTAAIVANAVLGTGYSSRLNQEIRIKRGLSYGAGSAFELRRDVGPFTASAQTKNESAADVAGLIIDELNRMAATQVPATELVPRKAVLIGGFGRSLETAAGLANRIGTLALYGLNLDEINKYISGVQSVSAEDVQKFASTHLGGSDATIVAVGDAKKFLPALQQRFKNVDVIPVAELDLNSTTLRHPK